MIRYALKCESDHAFESWFQSGDAFDRLQVAGRLSCPRCGSEEIRKDIMAPPVSTARRKVDPKAVHAPMHALTVPASPAEAAIAELKKKIQQHSEYVGKDFADEARRIHEGEAPERSIYGEASNEDARSLVEDGVPVAPLPFLPSRKAN